MSEPKDVQGPEPAEAAEPRAKDLAATPPAEGSPHPLDPATIAKLASWFDLPSFDQVAEQEEASRAEAERKTETEKVLEKRSRAMDSIEPWFVAGLEARRAAGARLPQVEPPSTRWDRPPLTFDDSRIPPAMDPEDYPETHIPPALIKDLRDCTPQAFLRDLHRPDKDFYIRLEPAFEDAGEPEAPDPMGPIREALRTDYRVGGVAPAVTTMAAGIADLRAILAQPWEASKRERARKREAELLRKEAEQAAVTTVPEGPP